ncbi:MAG: sigma-54-dependent transcriptional regulator [Oligoflexus sp.]
MSGEESTNNTSTPHDISKSIRGRRILIVDDHRNIRRSLRLTLESEGALVDEAETYAQALIKLKKFNKDNPPDFEAILLDIRLPDGNGLDVLKQLSHHQFASRVIMISGEGTVQEAFLATKMGAFDYIEKPFVPERILVSLGRCLEFNKIHENHAALQAKVNQGQSILGTAQCMEELRTIIERVAKTQGRVLILGESGTGKELIARSIHRISDRSNKPLIKVNCAAIPNSLVESELFGHDKGAFTGAVKSRKGLFEQAHDGTLFLDEIGELDLNVQAKLLRVLQNGELTPVGSEKVIRVDVRLIAATHRDLPDMVANGEFREDLYYRLNVVTIKAPPLRERQSDIPMLAQHFLHLACEEHSIGERHLSAQVLQQLQAYPWPGNIRELKNLIERTVILSDSMEITTIRELEEHIPASTSALNEKSIHTTQTAGKATVHGGKFEFSSPIKPWQEIQQSLGRSYIKHVLEQCQGNVSEAARILCLERAYLHRLMKKLGIQRGVVVSD